MKRDSSNGGRRDSVVGYDRFLSAKIAADTAGIQSHYDLPVEFFASFLGPRMAYSCAYFTDPANTLMRAEEDKLRLTAQKLELQPGDRLVDLGCGWGSFLFFAAEEYGCSATGITLSKEQVAHVNRVAAERGLSGRVKAELVHVYEMDYPRGSFDKAVTIGAIEHIEDLPRMFRKTHEILGDEGLFMCHGMTKPWSQRVRQMSGEHDEVGEIVERHFGVGYWKSLWEVTEALEKAGFEVLDEENITQHYALTCMRWLENLQAREAEIAGKIVPDEKYREFVALMAGYITGFQLSGTICNQILCQKHADNVPRPERPLTRRHMLVSEPKEVTVDAPDLERELTAAEKVKRLLTSKVRQEKKAPVFARDDSLRAPDPELRDLFEIQLARAVKSHPEINGQIDGYVMLELTAADACAYGVDLRNTPGEPVVPGRCEGPLCAITMDSHDFRGLLAGGTVTDWLDAFKARRINFTGSLVTGLRLQSIISEIAGNDETRRQLSA